MKVYQELSELIGNTPIVRLKGYEAKLNIRGNIFAKLEYLNPAGSIKDRIALEMILDAEKKKLLKKDSVIIEPTSGNTGIGLAAIGASKGYRVILTMPESMSVERILLLKAYGAEIVLTKASEGMKGAIKKALELAKEIPHSFIPGQFTNLSNPLAHYKTTGPEIFKSLSGRVDILIAGIGTGGTISGVGKYLKEKNPRIKIIGVEPLGSPLLSKGTIGTHKLQGIGAGFLPITLDVNVYDEILAIADEDAFRAAKQVALSDGVLVGISSGAALEAAKIVGQRLENKNKRIVVILPDGGAKYLSTGLFD
jgi:cysteine synthase A